MQKWLTNDKIEMRFGTFQAFLDEIKAQIYNFKLHDKHKVMKKENLL